ncbi:MAG: hypothetical protein ABIB04_02695 [Patescibacteria group bacterium]
MKINKIFHIEWISLVYLTLFVLAVFSPKIIKHTYFSFEEETVEELLIFVFGLAGILIFSLYQRLIEHKEREREVVENEREKIKRELVESYKYIGSINRQVNVLKNIANKTSLEIVEKDKFTKDILVSLLANAAASVGTKTAFVRFLDLERGRTSHEVLHSLEGVSSLKVSNKDLIQIHDTGVSQAFITSECGKKLFVVPSDHREVPEKAFLLTLLDPSLAEEIDTSLLKVFVNQAELIYHTLKKQNGHKEYVPEADAQLSN